MQVQFTKCETGHVSKLHNQDYKNGYAVKFNEFLESAGQFIILSMEFLKDFQPINKWTECEDDKNWEGVGEVIPEFLIDETTGKRYWNEGANSVREKCTLLTLGTLFIQPVLSFIPVTRRIVKLVSFSYFWTNKQDEKSYSFKERTGNAALDLLRVIATPIAIVGLELAAIYGIITPYDGRKLYASIERNMFEKGEKRLLAPCFQPDPTEHGLGGDPTVRGAW